MKASLYRTHQFNSFLAFRCQILITDKEASERYDHIFIWIQFIYRPLGWGGFEAFGDEDWGLIVPELDKEFDVVDLADGYDIVVSGFFEVNVV
jgi:hypothetical protein